MATPPRLHAACLLLALFASCGVVGCGGAFGDAAKGGNATLRGHDESTGPLGDLDGERQSVDAVDSLPTVPPVSVASLTHEERVTREAELAAFVSERKIELLDAYLESPFPSPDASNADDRCWGRAGFALAAYTRGRELARADEYIRDIHSSSGFASTGAADDSPCYFAMPLLLRIYFGASAAAHLTDETRALLLDLMLDFVFARSKVDVAEGSTWLVVMSENHDAIQKAAYLLASRALVEAETPYGPDFVLGDGRTAAQHYAAWQRFWREYFRERAGEGIGCEIASPVYAKHALASYYGVLDFGGGEALTSIANSFLTLYWSDVAQDFLPGSGVRGGAETRTYKNGYLTQGTRQSVRPWAYLYDWHDTPNASTHPLTLVAAASPYLPPALVHAQATDKDTPYLYASRRCGRGGMTRVDGEPLYRISFDHGRGSHILRTSFVTADYVIGALSFDPDEPYNNLAGQNRTMGVSFGSDVNDRIVIHGRGLDKNGTIGYDEITGVVAENVLAVSRDPEFRRSSGVRIFISKGQLWDERVEYAGWFFTRTDAAYVAIRMSEAGYVVHGDPNGKMLDQVDSWTPIIVQMGQARDYASFGAFQASVVANGYVIKRSAAVVTKSGLTSDDFATVTSRIDYRSEAGAVLTTYSHNQRLPKRDGKPIDLLPNHTYSSPWLESEYGSDRVRLSHPLFGALELDFSEPG